MRKKCNTGKMSNTLYEDFVRMVKNWLLAAFGVLNKDNLRGKGVQHGVPNDV